MSYTPTILFDRDNLTPARVQSAQERREDDSPSRAFAEELVYQLAAPVKMLRGVSIAFLSPDFSSETDHYREVLNDWGIEYIEIGG